MSTLIVDNPMQEEPMTSKPRRPLGLAEIADLLGVGEATPTRWKYRKAVTGFPDPDGFVSGTVPYWWETTIERWAKATGRWPGDQQAAAASEEEQARRAARREAEERSREAERLRARLAATQAELEQAEAAAAAARVRLAEPVPA